MDQLIREMVAQSPAVAVLLYLVWRLDRRLQTMTDDLIATLRDALEASERREDED